MSVFDTGGRDLHRLLHLLKGSICLVEEPVDDALAEVPVLVVVIHFQDLVKGGLVNPVTKVRETGRTLLQDETSWSAWSTVEYDRGRTYRLAGRLCGWRHGVQKRVERRRRRRRRKRRIDQGTT